MENCIGINKIGSMLRAPSCPFVLSVGTKKPVSYTHLFDHNTEGREQVIALAAERQNGTKHARKFALFTDVFYGEDFGSCLLYTSTANFRHTSCPGQKKHGCCKNRSCLAPEPVSYTHLFSKMTAMPSCLSARI